MWMSKVKKYLISIDTGFALKATFVFSMCCICLVFSFAVINGAMEILGLNSKSDVYRSSYHLTPASNRCLVYATLVRTSFGINFRPFLNML